MKHVTYAEKSLLIGNEAADLLMEYAAAVSRVHSSDTVDLKAIGSDGNAVEATFLLGVGAPLMVETASAELNEPDNSGPIEYMMVRLRSLDSRAQVMAVDASEFDEDDFGDFPKL